MKNGVLRKWADTLTKNTYALYFASKDQRVPVYVKVIIGIVVAYALSPVDLIPDFIPVLGLVDDLLLLPLGIWLVMRLVPSHVWKDCQSMAEKQTRSVSHNLKAAAAIIIIWILALAGFVFWAWQFFSIKSEY